MFFLEKNTNIFQIKSKIKLKNDVNDAIELLELTENELKEIKTPTKYYTPFLINGGIVYIDEIEVRKYLLKTAIEDEDYDKAEFYCQELNKIKATRKGEIKKNDE